MTHQRIRGGHVLKSVRNHLGLTQEQVCEMMDWPVRTYQRWEREYSEPPFCVVLAACSSAFQMSIDKALLLAQRGQHHV